MAQDRRLHMESGYNRDDSFICEECSDAEEARKISKHFAAVAAAIEKQIAEQGGW